MGARSFLRPDHRFRRTSIWAECPPQREHRATSWVSLREATHRRDLAIELGYGAVTDHIASLGRVDDFAAADVVRDVVRPVGAAVAEEDQIARLLRVPPDPFADADLVAGEVGKPE